MKFLTRLFVLFAFLLSGQNIFSQSTKINYKKKGGIGYPAIITLTDNNSKTNIHPSDFIKSPHLYFTVTPDPTARKQYFKENDVTDFFSGISIGQDNIQIEQNNTPKRFIDNSGKIKSVLLSFPKDKIKLYETFVLADKIDTTNIITIHENLLPSINKYKNIFAEAQILMGKKEAINAFNSFYQIEKDAQSNPEIKAYSFYQKAAFVLPKTIIKNYADSLYKKFLKQHHLFQKEKTKPTLDSCEAILQTFHHSLTVFRPYLKINEDGIPQLETKILGISNKMDANYKADKLLLKQSILALLETGNYTNYKFFLFVDVLNRMLCNIDSVKILNGIPLLDINTLNKFPDKTNELVSTGWFNEFKNLTDLLNDNIKHQNFIFDSDVLSHLKLIDTLEREPYYEIFSAFNSLEKNFQKFPPSMNQAIVKCSDSLLLNNMDMWMVSYQMTYEQTGNKFVSEINKGIKQIHNNQWKEADKTFNIIKRQTSTLATPWFYSAVIKYHENELFSANAQLSKSLKLYPHYLAPHIFLFKNLLLQKRYADLLVNADSAISSFNIWYFHYIKAISLFKLNQSQACIDELLNQCIPMNSWNLSEYFLLGDAYLKLNNFEKAKNAYLKTRDIDPYSDSEYFNKKMQHLYNIKNNHSLKKH